MLTGPLITPHSGKNAESLVVLLHGLGSSGDDLIGIAEEYKHELPNTHFVAPHAPHPYGPGHQWFSLWDTPPHLILEGAHQAADKVNAYIDAQMARFGLTLDRVAVVGFSQGTMTALHAMLRREKPCAAVLGYSGLLLNAAALQAEVRAKPPVCLIHGGADMVVPIAYLREAEDALRGAGVSVESHMRPGLGHGIDNTAIRYGLDFLKKHLA